MMHLKRQIFSVFISLLSVTTGFAQKKTIPNVSAIELRNMNAIITNSEVSGYYMFYKTDRLSSNNYSYEIKLLDQNLSEAGTQSIEGSKYLTILDVAFNNASLMLKMYDERSNDLTFMQFDHQLNETLKRKRKANIIEKMAIDNKTPNSNLMPLNQTGFIHYRSYKRKKYGYIINFYPSNEPYREWTYSSEKGSDFNEFAEFIYGDEYVLISGIFKRSSVKGSDVKMFLLAIDPATGEKMYELELADPDYEIRVMSGIGTDADGNVNLLGNFYPKGANPANSSSLGFYQTTLDKKGNVLDKNYVSWANDVSKFIEVNEKGKVKDGGYNFTHKVVRNADRNIYVIGEQYRSDLKSNSLDIIIEDLMIFELDSSYKLQKVNVVDKESTILKFPLSFSSIGMHTLSYLTNAMGGFDYEFITFNKDKSVFTIGYRDYIQSNEEPNKLIYGSITYSDSQHYQDSIILKTDEDKHNVRILPAKIGNIVIVEYLPKQKKLNLKMEKINY